MPTTKKRKTPQQNSDSDVHADLDFSEWALQDTAANKAPLPSVSASDPPHPRWLGVQSLVNIVTGRDGPECKATVCNASKKGVTFRMGYVVGRRQETHVVMPEEAPVAVVNLFPKSLALRVLWNESFFAKLKEAGASEQTLKETIVEVINELLVYTPAELEALTAFCNICGAKTDGTKFPIRGGRVDGKLVVSLIEVVMLAKKCDYEAAKKICQRLLKDYWNVDMNLDLNGITEGTDLSPQLFHSLRLQCGNNGGQATICVDAECAAEVLILIPGCELSVTLRRDMIRSFFGAGENVVTFESLLANPRIRNHVKNLDHPVGEYVEAQEHKESLQKLPHQLHQLQRHNEEMQVTLQELDEGMKLALRQRDEDMQLTLKRHDEGMQLALRQRVEDMQLALKQRDEDMQLALRQLDANMQLVMRAALKQHGEDMRALHEDSRREHLQAIEHARISTLQDLGVKFANFTMQIAGHLRTVVVAAVKEGLGLKKAISKRKTTNSHEMPENQRATSVQAGPLALALSTMALEFFPAMHYAVWKQLRGSFGHHAKKERLRLNALGERHPEYVEKPLLWSYTGATVEGGGARYVYLQEQRALLRRVFTAQLQTTSTQRTAGAPRPTESLEQRAYRLDGKLSAPERALQWPEHTAEHEPQWDEI